MEITFDNTCRLRKQKLILLLFLIGFGCGFVIANIFSLLESSSNSLETVFNDIRTLEDYQKEKLASDDFIKCKVPKLNPWDPSIRHWIEHPKSVECAQVQRFMTYMDDEGTLRMNETETNKMKEQNITFHCLYRTFDRNFGLDDESILFDPYLNLIQPVTLKKDSGEVICKYENGTEFYWNTYAYPTIRDDMLFAKPTEDQLSILFFMVDSVAHSVLRRNLPITYNYTKNVMGIKFFDGKQFLNTVVRVI